MKLTDRFFQRINRELYSFFGFILSIIALGSNQIMSYIPMYIPKLGGLQATELSMAYVSFMAGFGLLAVICLWLFLTEK